MKLTRSQRLFVALGKLNARILGESGVLNADENGANATQEFRLKQLRAFSKLLLSAALEAYETEKLVQQASAYERSFCAGRRINNTIKKHNTLNTMEKQNITLDDIKVGEKYKLELRCLHNAEKIIVFETPTGDHIPLRNSDLECICPKTPPKYDPCRLLRKGDKVQVKKRNGRCNGKDGEYLREAFCTVAKDETQNELVRVLHNATEYRLDPAYLELVTPVEELERYILIHNKNEKCYEVCWKDEDEPDGLTGRTRCRATYWYHLPPQTYSQKEAKAAAEAERDRLNADYRRGQNGSAPNS